MKHNIEQLKNSVFESIKKINQIGQEYWSARQMYKALDYKDWRKFVNVINKAKEACKNSEQQVENHFAQVDKMVKIGSGAERNVGDLFLSRYACYLIIQNADPKKEVVALGQTYFAIQTRKQELAANLFRATQTEEKLKRDNVKTKNKANETHYKVGKKVRKTIEELGGTMPENLPVADSIKKQLKETKQKKNLNDNKE